jgi:hypothetical protein
MACRIFFLQPPLCLPTVNQFFDIEEFGIVLPHFIFPSVPQLSDGPCFSNICYLNSFWDYVELPYYMPSPL